MFLAQKAEFPFLFYLRIILFLSQKFWNLAAGPQFLQIDPGIRLAAGTENSIVPGIQVYAL